MSPARPDLLPALRKAQAAAARLGRAQRRAIDARERLYWRRAKFGDVVSDREYEQAIRLIDRLGERLERAEDRAERIRIEYETGAPGEPYRPPPRTMPAGQAAMLFGEEEEGIADA